MIKFIVVMGTIYALAFVGVYFGIKIIPLLVILFLATIFITYRIFVSPIRKLKKALDLIDFSEDCVDFTMLDTLRLPHKDFNYLVRKYRYLADNLSKRINRVNEEVDKSTHDSLSGCYNRTYLERMVGVYHNMNSLFVLFIDVNNLKRMNDEFGHEAGDILIKAAASKLKYWETYGDVYRMGGDEFMVVVPNIPEEDCVKYLDCWYPTVGSLNHRSSKFLCLLAYGYAYGGKFSCIDKLMKVADERMYRHKKEIKAKCGEEMR